LLFYFPFIDRRTLIARAVHPQVLPRIYPGVMTVCPFYLNRIRANLSNIYDLILTWIISYWLRSNLPEQDGLTLTAGTWAERT